MARKAVIPDTDTEEVAGLPNEHALGTGARSGSRSGSKRRGGFPKSPKAGSLNKTRNIGAQANRGPNNNIANKAVKRAPEHGRQLRSATRSMEPQATPERKRKRDVFDMESLIEEEAEEREVGERLEGNGSRTTERRKQTARPSKMMRSNRETRAADERQPAPRSSLVSRAGPDEYSDRRNHLAVQDSEVESQESEAEARDSVEEETEGEEALEKKMLLGNEHFWKMIMKASGRNRKRAEHSTELESNIMSDLVEKLTEARQIYHSLAVDDLAPEEIDETEAELDDGLNEICVTVDDLSEASAGSQASTVVFEAYMNGVTQFLSLLKEAMKGRVLKSSPKAYDVDGLEEVVFVQGMLLRFLEKLNSWKVSSEGYLEGFTRNVQQRIKPYLRAMLDNFKKHLAGEWIAEKRRINRDITASQPVAGIASPQLQQQTKLARLEAIRRRILKSAQDESLRWGGNLRLVEEVRGPELQRAPSASAAETRSDAWTTEEDTALIHELLNNRETRGLPVDERYRMILNNELLSNKLPEHIEERAMWHKPYLVQQMREDFEGRVPRWVDSIRRTAGQ